MMKLLSLFFSVFFFSLPVFAENMGAAPVPMPKPAMQKSSAAVNINTADAKAIIDAKIKGIGKKRAEEIINYRQQHGPFKSLDDLKNIKGISQKVIDDNRDRLTTG